MGNTDSPLVSVIIPCRNEEAYLRGCLNSVLRADYPSDNMELLIVDGMSTDNTRAIISEYTAKHKNLRLVNNPERIVPTGFNRALREARGDVILRMDAHAEYPVEYIRLCVEHLMDSKADNVGGVWETVPGATTVTARAIALALSHWYGVGNAYFRIGTATPRKVDTVPFGCYRRSVFDRIGFFDEDLARNQDDEFNLRLIKAGGTIMLYPDIRSRYFGRTSLTQLFRMYYQYGFFKPFVVRKTGGMVTARQLAPPILVLSLLFSFLSCFWIASARFVLAAISGTYCLITLVIATCIGLRNEVILVPALCASLAVMHVAYGLGYINGFLRLPWRGHKSKDVPLSR
jgi:glycosyltransferase involved in cell wall biosynthesis